MCGSTPAESGLGVGQQNTFDGCAMQIVAGSQGGVVEPSRSSGRMGNYLHVTCLGVR